MTPIRTIPPRFAGLALSSARLGTIVLLAAACGGGDSPTSPGTTTGGGNQTIANVSVSGNATSVAVGSTVTLTANARNAAGSVVSATFAWTSSNTAVATVGASTGIVTGVTVGNATITAAAGGFSGTRVITVTAPGTTGPPPTAAQIDMPGTAFEPNAVTIAQGGTITWVFTALGHNVNFSSTAGVSDIPISTNQSVARTFNTKGTFTMSCTVHAGMTGTITVQ